ncbi:MAG: histidine phosphatase family protein [Thiogranum sp.]|nr:histidine phosphatase family protein [Thiogranum sp.]
MLQLTLIRHAKSSWNEPNLSDFDRPLNRRGLDNAPMMGRVIKHKGLAFDRMVSSPAQRAITTARLIAAETGYPENAIAIREDLYDASVDTLLECVQSLDAHEPRTALVGHNPGMTQLYNALTGETLDNLPTCAVAVIEFDVEDWRAVHPGLGRSVLLEYPKKHQHHAGR